MTPHHVDETKQQDPSTLRKVAVVLPQGKVSGAEKMLLELLADSLPYEIVVCAPVESELSDACLLLGYTVEDFYLPKLRDVGVRRFPRQLIHSIMALREIVLEHEIDILHGFLSLTEKVVVPVGVVTNRPIVMSVHDVVTSEAIGWWRSRAHLFLARASGLHSIAVSEFVRRSMMDAGYQANRIRVVHNGVARPAIIDGPPSRDSLGIPTDAVVFMQLGRITRWKGHMLALEAFHRLCASNVGRDMHLVFAGRPFFKEDEGFYEKLQDAVAKSRYQDRIHFVEHTSAVGNLYEVADVVLVPSVAPDPFPTVVLEAAHCGRPVIVSNAGGGVEAVVHGETGFACEPTAASFVEAMFQTLDRRWRCSAGVAACDYAQRHFSRDAYRQGIVQAWREAGGKSRKSEAR